MTAYSEFIKSKMESESRFGFEPLWIPDQAFDFQSHLIDWSIRKGRSALFEDCGLGKTLQELTWAENVVRHTNKPVLILTPLAVAPQTVREGEKFGIEVHRTRKGKVFDGINVTNYERLHYYEPSDFAGVVLDESSILKNFDGKLRRAITTFLQQVQFRLLATATPAPNDFMELGTSSEALSVMPHAQMLGMFFTNGGETTSQWEIKPHGRKRFWQWMASWSRAIRTPDDLGYDSSKFLLPNLTLVQHVIPSSRPQRGFFPEPARTLSEQRHERKQTLQQRCEKVAEVISTQDPVVVWCHLNPEGDLLKSLIPDAVQVSGDDDDSVKEERLTAFSEGQIRVLVTKPKIASFGLNWQHCAEMSFFPSHSYEQYYQAIRRCLRFGQTRDVLCHVVTSQAESAVVANLKRKERQAEEMFRGMVHEMKAFQTKRRPDQTTLIETKVPTWLQSRKN